MTSYPTQLHITLSSIWLQTLMVRHCTVAQVLHSKLTDVVGFWVLFLLNCHKDVVTEVTVSKATQERSQFTRSRNIWWFLSVSCLMSSLRGEHTAAVTTTTTYVELILIPPSPFKLGCKNWIPNKHISFKKNAYLIFSI